MGGRDARTPHTDAALFVVKGAICVAFGIPLNRTTKNVKFSKGNKVSITVGPLGNEPTESQYQDLVNCIREKLLEDSSFLVFEIPRRRAEELYGDAMYDDFGVPQTITRLRLVALENWAVNAHSFPVVKSTGLIGKIEVMNVKYNVDKKFVEVSITVTPPQPQDLCATDAHSPTVANNSTSNLAVAQTFEDGEYPLANEILPVVGGGVVPDDESQKVTCWEVKADGGINYNKLLQQFGCSPVTPKLVQRIESLTKRTAHHFLRREIFFSHRDLALLLNAYAVGKQFYLYTGRGPSSESMHIGHLIPFMFTKWLQDAFNVPLVIQLTDDEKFLFKDNLPLEECHRLAYQNAKDIIAIGFDLKKTFVFSDLDYIHHMYPLILNIQKKITCSQARGVFGFNESDNIGKYHFPAVQAAPSFSTCFKGLLGSRDDMWCLIPQAIDQDPYFRMTRDVAPRLGYLKPALIHSKFFPALQGFKTKMSGSDPSTTIFTSDTANEIETKIRKHAFSGGQATEKEQREKGADLDVDIPYQYLYYLIEDDDELKKIGDAYASGKLLSGEIKKILTNKLCDLVQKHKEARAKVTDEQVRAFMDPNRCLIV